MELQLVFHSGRVARERCANKFITLRYYIYCIHEHSDTTWNCDNALATNCATAAIFLLARHRWEEKRFPLPSFPLALLVRVPYSVKASRNVFPQFWPVQNNRSWREVPPVRVSHAPPHKWNTEIPESRSRTRLDARLLRRRRHPRQRRHRRRRASRAA